MDGRTVASYAPEDWIFTKPALVDVPAQAGTLIGLDVVSTAIEGLSVDTDLLLLRTGHWRVRGDDSYWRDGAGLVAEAAQLLVSRFPSISAIGLDTISLTSYQHREEGRRAHRAFLGNDLRVFEDLSLGEVPRGSALAEVIAMPLRSSAGDGAPCSVIARIG
jgi:kynurenine formamidase